MKTLFAKNSIAIYFRTALIMTELTALLAVIPVSAEALVLPVHLDKVTDFLLQQKYDEVERIIRRTPLSDADSLFMEILLNQAKMVDYESYNIDGRKFLILCEAARDEFRKIEEYKRPPLLFYYLGTMEGAAALTRGKRGDMMGALTASNVSKRNLDILIKKDSTFTPGYFGVGMRRYYSAALANKFGMGKKKLKSSIGQMEISATSDNVMGLSVLPSLFWIYLDNEMYDKAEECARRFLKSYPKSTLMLRGLAKLYVLREDYNSAESVAHRLMKSSERRVPVNWSDYYSAGVTIVITTIKNGHFREAIDEVDRLLAIENSEQTMKLEWVKKHRKHLKQLKEEAISKLE